MILHLFWVVSINRAGNESGLLQAVLQALTDAVQPVYHRIFIASRNAEWPFETQFSVAQFIAVCRA